jgi:transcriptional regulator with XRE-family HTH domain
LQSMIRPSETPAGRQDTQGREQLATAVPCMGPQQTPRPVAHRRPNAPSGADELVLPSIPLAPDWLREARLARGLTLASVGATIGVYRSTVHKWERRQRSPGPHHIRLLAQVFDVAPEEIERFVRAYLPPHEQPATLPGRGLRLLRDAHGLTGRQVAAALGVPRHHVYNWELGACRIPAVFAPPLADLFGLESDTLGQQLWRTATYVRPPTPVGPLVRLRKGSGLSQREAAARLGVAQTHLRAWERGQRPPLGKVRRIALLYGVGVAQVTAAAGVKAPLELSPGNWRAGTLPKVLRCLRQWSDLTQTQLAELLSVSQSSIRAWEAGRQQPTSTHRRRIEQLFRLPQHSLLAAYVKGPGSRTTRRSM